MTTHELKIWPEFFDEILCYHKRYEVRLNDRDFQKGDRLILREFDPVDKFYTGRECEAKVVHITYRNAEPLSQIFPLDLCVMGIEPIKWRQRERTTK